MPRGALTTKQRIFAEGIARGKSQREAATLAGSTQPDMMGTKWIKKPQVRIYLDQLRAEASRLVAEEAAASATVVALSASDTARDMAQQRVYLWEMAEGKRPAEWLEGPDGSIKFKRFKPLPALIQLWEMDRPMDHGPGVNVQVLNQLPIAFVREAYQKLVGGSNGNGNGHAPEERE